MHKFVDICSIRFPLIDYNKTIGLFEKWINQGKSRHVCITNVHTLVTALKDKEFKNIVDCADLITIDGQPLRWYAKLIRGVHIKDRITGPELMLKSIEFGNNKRWCHFLLGGTEEVLWKLRKNLIEKFEGINIVGTYSPPFRTLTKEEDAALVERINKAHPDFLWVGLGAPKQEKWISNHLSRIHVPIQIGVGAAFDFHSGNIKRAPEFLQRIGLEWLYRIYRDLKLYKKYLQTNPIFMLIFIRDFIKIKVFQK
ncbi:MAG: WecB/TagA/CpsF family glycosyltransferase [Deltaproteobacteria bacterium]|nr:WecB/TagA/CpsF family glycosyltransferase [Deltaproteobacteria bacterium]